MLDLNEISYKPIFIRFAWVYTIATIILAIVSYALDQYLGIEMPSSVSGFVPMLIGVCGASALFVKTYSRAASREESIHLAKKSVLISLALSLIFIAIVLAFFMLSGELTLSDVGALFSNPVVWGSAGFALLFVLIIFYFGTRFLYQQITTKLVQALNGNHPQK